MREAGDAARPVLASFAKGIPVTLGPAEQKAVAFWTLKTLLALLMVEPQKFRFATPARYRELFELRSPPPR
ncbi:MAG: hypothetical protein M3R46_11710 [Actinomycetota bacterium]|nr:hypothetical protein [Actinomycetota bacterium]